MVEKEVKEDVKVGELDGDGDGDGDGGGGDAIFLFSPYSLTRGGRYIGSVG